MLRNDTGEQAGQKAVLNPFIPRLNIKSFSLFPADMLCVFLMPTWLGALLAGTADGIRQREFSPAGACEDTSVNPLSGVFWVVWAYFIPPFHEMCLLKMY